MVSVAVYGADSGSGTIVAPSSKYAARGWFEFASQLPPLAYDHTQMATMALSRLKAKLEYTNIAAFLLPKSFTFKELEDVYGAILGRSLDRRNIPPPDIRSICSGNGRRSGAGPIAGRAIQLSKIQSTGRAGICYKLIYSRQGKQ